MERGRAGCRGGRGRGRGQCSGQGQGGGGGGRGPGRGGQPQSQPPNQGCGGRFQTQGRGQPGNAQFQGRGWAPMPSPAPAPTRNPSVGGGEGIPIPPQGRGWGQPFSSTVRTPQPAPIPIPPQGRGWGQPFSSTVRTPQPAPIPIPPQGRGWGQPLSSTVRTPQPAPIPIPPQGRGWGPAPQAAPTRPSAPVQVQPQPPAFVQTQLPNVVVPAADIPSSTGMELSMQKLTFSESAGSSSSTNPRSQSGENSVKPMSRPDRGGTKNADKPVRLLANFFPLKINPNGLIKHYDIDIQKLVIKDGKEMATNGSFSKETASLILDQVVLGDLRFKNLPLVFDGKKNIYCCHPVPGGTFTVQLAQDQDEKSRRFKVSIKDTGHDLPMNLLGPLLDPRNRSHVGIPQDLFQALDLVVRHYPSLNRFLIGRTLYSSKLLREWNLGSGVTASTGFYQSIRPTASGLALNVDLSAVAFHKPIKVLAFLDEIFKEGLRRTLTKKILGEIGKLLKGLKVTVTHRKCSQKFIVKGLTLKPADEISFDDGTSLVEYYKQKHKCDIKMKKFPCLDISKSNDRPQYVPMEFCVIYPGQRFPRADLNGRQDQYFKQIACPRAEQRKQQIRNIMDAEDGPLGGNYLEQYGIGIESEMMRINGRILDPPQLCLGGQKTLVPSPQKAREWNLIEKHVYQGKTIMCWAVVAFTYTDGDLSYLRAYGDMLTKRLREIGIDIRTQPCMLKFYPIDSLSNQNDVHRILSEVWRKSGGKLQFLLCVMDSKHPGYYTLKLVAETQVGVITQCCLTKNFDKTGNTLSQYLANLGLKINAKLGGSTVAIQGRVSRYVPRLGTSKIMIIGADVNHPKAGDKTSPSISALVASMNDPVHTTYHSRISYQRHRNEHILDLGQMARELLDDYKKLNGVYPERIIFFRDGVSETQFEMVLNAELDLLKKEAIAKIENYDPLVTLIVARKRHHTRLFMAEGQKGEARSDNPSPGTVVDTVIVDPRCFDFYLNSHHGLLGTSKPTHYTVLYDENGFASDEIQTLIYHLCYTYASCTKPVSLVTPVYYADLAAYRGRDHYQGSFSDSVSTASLGSPTTEDLAKLKVHQNVINSMFFC